MQQYNNITILAVDTSCDDTCVSILKTQPRPFGKTKRAGLAGVKNFTPTPKFGVGASKSKIISNIVSSQVEIHRKWGGVFPSLAKREHQRNLVPVLERAMSEAEMLEKSKIQMSNVKSNPKSKIQNLEEILERETDLFKDLTNFLKKYQKPKIDIIAVTVGPGLEPCLWTGVNFAKALSYWWELPVIPVNHIEAHILANFIGSNSKSKIQNPKLQSTLRRVPNFVRSSKIKNLFPAVCLVVSGGHTQLILMRDFGKHKILGETRDDAAGECLDKVARILGLGYPGGPAIAAKAAMEIPNPKSQIPNKFKIQKQPCGESVASLRPAKFKIKLPRPMIYSRDYDFSFSGLKTAVLYEFRNRDPKTRKSKQYIQAISAEIQQAVIDVLLRKTSKAAREYKARTIILGGGVAANQELRKQFKEKIKKIIPNSLLLIPEPRFCTDNAAMVAITAYYHQKATKRWKDIEADANLSIV